MATRLIIKGTMADAIRAAVKHGVPLYRARSHPEYMEVICDTLDLDWSRGLPVVVKWFMEESDAPFPLGSLIWYGERCEPLVADMLPAFDTCVALMRNVPSLVWC